MKNDKENTEAEPIITALDIEPFNRPFNTIIPKRRVVEPDVSGEGDEIRSTGKNVR